MRKTWAILTVFTFAAGLAACDSMPFSGKEQENKGLTHILYSPTGDPLNGGPLGRPTCADAIRKWFDRVDANHDESVTSDEFLNDAKTQFQRMDIDHNGYLVSEEVERFRITYRDGLTGKTDDKPEEKENRKHEGIGSGYVIDPVMSADADLDYKVTPEEFQAYSQKTFKSLDVDHNSALTLEEVSVVCGDKGHEVH